MDILIIGRSGNATIYRPAELLKTARQAVKGKGKLVSHWVTVTESIGVTLNAQFVRADGFGETIGIAI